MLLQCCVFAEFPQSFHTVLKLTYCSLENPTKEKLANNADPDQMPPNVASDQGL